MTHLAPTEFVDLLEGRLDEDRAAHARTCPSCAGQAADVRDALSTASAPDVPEPPAMFWDAFSARVKEAVEEVGAPRRGWWRQPAVVLACAAVILASVLFMRGGAGRLTPPANVDAHAPQPVSSQSVVAADTNDDAAWEFLADAAAGMDDGSQDAVLTVSPQAVDQAVVDLTPAERDELGRLLERELHRSGA